MGLKMRSKNRNKMHAASLHSHLNIMSKHGYKTVQRSGRGGGGGGCIYLFYKHQFYIEFLATEKNRILTHVKNTIFFTCENIIFVSQSKTA